MPNTFFEWIIFLWKEYWPLLLKGAGTSLYISFLGTAMGFVLGLLVAIVRSIPYPSKKNKVPYFLLRFVHFLCAAYVEIFRGTPLMVQAMVIYYGLLRLLPFKISLAVASIFIVGVNTGAYMTEIMRSGINSIDKGQTEAAVSIGMTHWQTMRKIILPQAVRNVLPSVGNEFVVNVKDTSVLNVIAVSELFFVGKCAAGTYFKFLEIYCIVAVIYFIITMILSRILNRIEKKMSGPAEFELVEEEDTEEDNNG